MQRHTLLEVIRSQEGVKLAERQLPDPVSRAILSLASADGVLWLCDWKLFILEETGANRGTSGHLEIFFLE